MIKPIRVGMNKRWCNVVPEPDSDTGYIGYLATNNDEKLEMLRRKQEELIIAFNKKHHTPTVPGCEDMSGSDYLDRR